MPSLARRPLSRPFWLFYPHQLSHGPLRISALPYGGVHSRFEYSWGFL